MLTRASALQGEAGRNGCPARIRTSIDGVRVRSLTFRRRGSAGRGIGPGPERVKAAVAPDPVRPLAWTMQAPPRSGAIPVRRPRLERRRRRMALPILEPGQFIEGGQI